MGYFVIDPHDVRKMQMKGLEMALFFDKFCKENNLLYYMCGGCCIGAVRNKGFIPWDDDVDVFMPRPDYEKLKTLWKDTDDYSIQYTTEDYITENQFLTICSNKTTFIKTYQKDLDINHGLVMDVIPLDGCPEGIKRKSQKFFALLYSLFIIGKAPENHGKAVYGLGKIMLSLVNSRKMRYKIWKFCEKQMTRYPIEDCKYITELCTGPHYMQNEYPKEIFESAIRLPFEGHDMPVPVGYDRYLRIAFGDYMKLPPADKQVCHHEYEVLDMDNPYLIYKGKKYMKNSERSI